jgi:hypothetical protein
MPFTKQDSRIFIPTTFLILDLKSIMICKILEKDMEKRSMQEVILDNFKVNYPDSYEKIKDKKAEYQIKVILNGIETLWEI